LRQAREERGISLSEVAEQTRISSLYLESIENDDYKPLPGGIFNKGFVKSYARFIGVDETEALQDYAKIVAETEGRAAEGPNKAYRPEVLTDDRAGSMIPTIIFAGIILALMTGGVLFIVNYLQNQPDTPVANTTPANSNINADADEKPAGDGAVPDFNELNVAFTAAKENISLTSVVDGTTRTEVVKGGETRDFTAKESVKLSYYRGFAEMVGLRLNGKEITPPGPPERGNIITFEITRANAEAIWQAGDVNAEAPIASAEPASTTPAAAATVRQTPTATPAPAATRAASTPQATPRRTATPARTPETLPTRRVIVVGNTASPTPRATPE
jgi:cytoskeleton protein RodZ